MPGSAGSHFVKAALLLSASMNELGPMAAAAEDIGGTISESRPTTALPKPEKGSKFDSPSGGPEGRIVNGVPAELGDVPWQVRVHQADRMLYCGGSLIDPSWVMTAAHCCINIFGQGFPAYVVAGTLSSSIGTGQERNVDQVVQHLEWGPLNFINDICLLRLDKPMELNDFTNVVKLSTGKLPGDVNCVVSGWGRTSFEGPVSPALLKANVTSLSHAQCESETKGTVDEEALFCASGERNGLSSDWCQGDSGGAVVCYNETANENLQEGIVSGASECGARGPGISTRVFEQLGWIQGILKENADVGSGLAPALPFALLGFFVALARGQAGAGGI